MALLFPTFVISSRWRSCSAETSLAPYYAHRSIHRYMSLFRCGSNILQLKAHSRHTYLERASLPVPTATGNTTTPHGLGRFRRDAEHGSTLDRLATAKLHGQYERSPRYFTVASDTPPPPSWPKVRVPSLQPPSHCTSPRGTVLLPTSGHVRKLAQYSCKRRGEPAVHFIQGSIRKAQLGRM